jgi:8-oxo-dGTP diphosphatase
MIQNNNWTDNPSFYQFTLCLLFHRDQVLMIERKKEPNIGLWNGVGGHIEQNESPLGSCLREVEEETGICLSTLRFGGILTWESWSHPPGGMYLFSQYLSEPAFINSDEGPLAWKPVDWVMSSNQVVANIPDFLMDIMKEIPPIRYHCVFNGELLLETRNMPLPTWITEEWLNRGNFRL